MAAISGEGQYTVQTRAVTGYAGIWYANEQQAQYGYKYSGGLATYPQQQMPVALYDAVAHTTFFVYGGNDGEGWLDNRVGAFDHASGLVSRPSTVLHRATWDAHYNAVIAQDQTGYLYLFCNSHGRGHELAPDDPTYDKAYIYRSCRPRSIDAFECILTDNFSYSHVWPLPDSRMMWLHTRYQDAARPLFWSIGDGAAWSAPSPLASIERGNYQISACRGDLVATIFDFHPAEIGLNARTNLYYLQTRDGGRHWTTAGGMPVPLPVTERAHPALVRDFAAEGLLVYIKDLTFDSHGHPVLVYLTSRGPYAGPEGGPRHWWSARWTGSAWEHRPITTSSHNYDHGILCIDAPQQWRLIAPLADGPQPYGAGGVATVMESHDRGQSWRLQRRYDEIVDGRNHTYLRRPLHAHPDFEAIWADGDADAPSESRLYFMRRDGAVYRLPAYMESESACPELVAAPTT